jgi:MtN3 and saliva related transmembrane protein
MESASTLGLVAGTLTTIAFLPQVHKTWKSRSAKDISFGMFALFSTGVFLWILYGISINAMPVIIANVVTFVLAMTILAFKIRYK